MLALAKSLTVLGLVVLCVCVYGGTSLIHSSSRSFLKASGNIFTKGLILR